MHAIALSLTKAANGRNKSVLRNAMECGSARELKLPYSGFLSREKTFANCLKIDFRGENFREFAVTQCTTPTSAVSKYCLKIDFRGENFRKSPQKRELAKVFSRERNPLYGIG